MYNTYDSSFPRKKKTVFLCLRERERRERRERSVGDDVVDKASPARYEDAVVFLLPVVLVFLFFFTVFMDDK